MEQEEPFYKGFLLLPPVGKILLKKSWQQKHCLLFKASKFGIKRLEIYDTIDSKESKIITLEDCIKVYSKSVTVFCVTTKLAVYEFGALTEQSLQEWLNAIQTVCFPDEGLTVIEEDNDLYCSSGEGLFNVKLCPSPASQRCGLESKSYTLLLTATALQLKNIPDDRLLFTWPYQYIRRYGYKSGKFTFEAGRKCESGEGIFFLEHANQQDIFRCLAFKMKSMKKLLEGDSSPILESSDVQIQAAANMEARSRTPIPLSPISPPIPDSSLIKTELDHPLKPTKPAKPPRKAFVPKPPLEIPSLCGDQDYETVGKYDDIEVRNEAWRTLGVDNPSHSEQRNNNDEPEEYWSWGQVKREVENIKPLAPKVIVQGSTTDLDDTYYDKLNHFGSTSKLNTKSGYKQVLPMPVAPTPYQPSFNEYDEVQCLDMEPVRSADDSHLGYALIRKVPSKDNLMDNADDDKRRKDKVSHQFHNEEPYAIISKPKRV